MDMLQPPPLAPPALSTPDTHIFEDPTLSIPQSSSRYTGTELYNVYEINRTVQEIHDGGWRRIALQFPDEMLRDAPRIVEALEKDLVKIKAAPRAESEEAQEVKQSKLVIRSQGRHRLYILADTSYGACCVDEIAAEHVDAEVVVHYGRSCLSPTARLPVIYVFTTKPLDVEGVVEAFKNTYPTNEKAVVMADITYHSHIQAVREKIRSLGYDALFPDVVHDPSSLIPNRNIEITPEELKTYSLFHIGEPLPALLLTLSSRVKDMHIYTTNTATPKALQTNTSMALRRRYALLISLTTCSVFGILINTLSVKNYLSTVTSIKEMIDRVGKKSYTFVVGKVNAAKIANFAEIGGWVVVGCWESSLIESKDFYRPIITPFELSLALQGDGERVWSGEWRGDFEGISTTGSEANTNGGEDLEQENIDDLDGEEESQPPEFDLRTGRYVSHTRPMRAAFARTSESEQGKPVEATKALAKRAKGDIMSVNGVASPGAEYLRSQRTWTGLGSDFVETDGTLNIEEGRTGIARGYTVGESTEKA